MDDVHELMAAADADGDGQIDFPEFIQLLRETSAELSGATPVGASSMHVSQHLLSQPATATRR